MTKYLATIIISLFLKMQSSTAQPITSAWLQEYLRSQPGTALQTILADPLKYRAQVLYIQIDRDKENKPTLQPHYVHYNPALYFNPASMVKMPLAFLALEKLNRLNLLAVDHTTSMEFMQSQPWQTALGEDPTARSGKPGIGHFIKKAFLVSDNDAYNRLYQWMGQRELHDRLWEKGYTDVVIPRQFLGLDPEQGRYTNALRFTDVEEHPLYEQPEAYNPTPLPVGEPILLGKAHINRAGERVEGPFDFTHHNRLSLGDMANMLLSVMMPKAFNPNQRFNLTKDDYRFLRTWLSAYPSETDEPKYDTAKYYDSYVKFFFRDSTGKMPPSVRVFNKVGWAYGFLTDVSYVVDFEKGIEYLLAATAYVNSDEVINDGKYDYETLGWPFMYQLGQAIYRYEKQRTYTRKPDLEYLKMKYEKRDPMDTRPVIREVDN